MTTNEKRSDRSIVVGRGAKHTPDHPENLFQFSEPERVNRCWRNEVSQTCIISMRKLRGLAILMMSTFLPSVRSLSTIRVVPLVSGVTKTNLFERDVYVKRDDDYFHPESGLNGNKGRKFMTLLKDKNVPNNLISYGGIQSNSLAALCKVASCKKKKLWYFTNSIPASIKHKPIGSYKLALDSGATVSIRCKSYPVHFNAI